MGCSPSSSNIHSDTLPPSDSSTVHSRTSAVESRYVMSSAIPVHSTSQPSSSMSEKDAVRSFVRRHRLSDAASKAKLEKNHIGSSGGFDRGMQLLLQSGLATRTSSKFPISRENSLHRSLNSTSVPIVSEDKASSLRSSNISSYFPDRDSKASLQQQDPNPSHLTTTESIDTRDVDEEARELPGSTVISISSTLSGTGFSDKPGSKGENRFPLVSGNSVPVLPYRSDSITIRENALLGKIRPVGADGVRSDMDRIPSTQSSVVRSSILKRGETLGIISNRSRGLPSTSLGQLFLSQSTIPTEAASRQEIGLPSSSNEDSKRVSASEGQSASREERGIRPKKVRSGKSGGLSTIIRAVVESSKDAAPPLRHQLSPPVARKGKDGDSWGWTSDTSEFEESNTSEGETGNK